MDPAPKLTPVLDLNQELDRTVLRFFSPHQPCWFPGCEKMRARYEQDVVAAGGKNCPGCQKGAIIRAYMVRVRTVLEKLPPATAATP